MGVICWLRRCDCGTFKFSHYACQGDLFARCERVFFYPLTIVIGFQREIIGPAKLIVTLDLRLLISSFRFSFLDDYYMALEKDGRRKLSHYSEKFIIAAMSWVGDNKPATEAGAFAHAYYDPMRPPIIA